MGFGGKSRKQAQQAQIAALNQQNVLLDSQRKLAEDYRANFAVRNKGILDLQSKATGWLNRYEKGADVASLNPARVMANQQAADQVMSTMKVASKLGDRQAGGDADYQARLNSTATANIGKGLARLNEAGLVEELGNQRGILMDTSAYLSADEKSGFSMGSEVFNMSNSIFQNATTRRQMEMQRSQMALKMFTDVLGAGVGAFSSVMGAGASAGLWGSAGTGGST